jgi:RNA polymerase sigma factor (sigma-70 family)
VAKIAMGYRGYGLPVSELISEGNIGLMQGVKKFEPDRGFRLATYAMWWIRASIQEFILRSWSLVKMGTTAAQKKLFFNLRRMKNQIDAFEEGDLKPEDVTQIATTLGVTEDEVVSMNRRMSMGGDTSLNAPLKGDEGAESQWQDFWSTTARCRTSWSRTRRRSGFANASHQRHGGPERPREAHPGRAAAGGRSEDAGGAQPGLWRQPRAYPPDRGAGIREAAGLADEACGRARLLAGVLTLVAGPGPDRLRSMHRLLLSVALLIAVPVAATPSVPLDHLPALKGDYFSLASKATGTTYHIYVRLPLDYAEQPAKRYPIVYLLDGDSAFPMLAPQHLFMTIDDKTPEAIVVGIAYGGFGPVNRRERDFGEGAPAFQRFLSEELRPEVERRVRADPAGASSSVSRSVAPSSSGRP